MEGEKSAARWSPPEPRELPALREHLVDYLGSLSAHLFTEEVLRQNRGTIRPAGPPDSGAALLLADERRRLSRAQLYYVTAEITTAVLNAAGGVRDQWDIQPEDLPALTGFMVFAKPLASYVRDDGKPVPIVAVSWGETELIDSPHSGLWLTFWSATDFAAVARLAREFGVSAAEATRQARAQHAELTWDNEIYLPWGAVTVGVAETPGMVRRVDPRTLAAAGSTIEWLRVVFSGWIFCQPSEYSEVSEHPLSRTVRRRAERAGLSSAAVRVVSVSRTQRRSPAKPVASSGRRVGVRFEVAPFLRRQAYGPGWSRRRWTVVSGHWQGPADGPMKRGRKVTLVDRPPDDPAAS